MPRPLREEVADVLAPLGLRLSPAKTRIVHMSEAFDFLGFRIQWKRKRGTGKWYVYTFIADRPVRSLASFASSHEQNHPVLVAGPGPRQVELAVDQRPASRARVGEEHPELAVRDLPGRAGVLPLHPG